jgi:hypothetical protein
MQRPPAEDSSPQTGLRPRSGHPVVLSLTGETLGTLLRFSGDRFCVLTPDDRQLWLSADAIYIEHPLYVELICMRAGVGRYVVDPP